jgi:hypothetical protein
MKNGFELSEIKTLLQSKLGDLRFVQKADGKNIVFFEHQNDKITKETKENTKQQPKKTKNRDKDSFQKHNEPKKEENAETTLKEVRITNIPKKSQIWYLDKWDSQAIQNDKRLLGLGARDKLVDAIIILFDKEQQCLNVYFIELKSTLQNNGFGEIVEKIQHSISRFLLFLCLNENQHNQEPFKNARVEFKTILFFNRMADKVDISDKLELISITKTYQKIQTNEQKDASCVTTFETLLDNTQNPFKFIYREKEEIITISFDDLIQF